ncbi:MAG: hypothetical protein ABI261_07710 [Ginsengibacter sp.]
MEAIKLIGTSHNGKLTLSVPEEFDNKELELMIISSKEKEKTEDKEIQEKKRQRKALLSIVGTAKHPDFPMTKYDVYDQ